MSQGSFELNYFPSGVNEALQHYVYALCRANGTVFYIGRGVDGRVFAHAREALKLKSGEGSVSKKCQTIIDSLLTGESGKAYIVAFGMNESEATALEAILIAFSMKVLTNCLGGEFQLENKVHGKSGHNLMMALEDITETLAPERADFGEKRLVLLSFNSNYDPNLRTEYRLGPHPHFTHCWILNETDACQAEFVVAVADGIIRSVCKPTKWFKSSRENGGDGLAFEGSVDEEMSDEWVGKALPLGCGFGAGNPVRYYPAR